MRMRKKKWAEPYLLAHEDFVYTDPVVYKGRWKELLNCRMLHVEIGMGKGGYLSAMALMYPQEGWIGIEKDISAAAVAARKVLSAKDRDITNIRMIYNRGEYLERWFLPGEIDVLHLNFSDPWPKKYTRKRRLSSAGFLAIYKTLLSGEGIIRIKTDNRNFFEDTILSLEAEDFCLTEISLDYRFQEHPEEACSEYEQRFVEEGKPIYQLAARIREKKDLVNFDKGSQ